MSNKKEEYEKALKTVAEYQKELNLKFVNDRICCICRKNSIHTIEGGSTKPLNQEQGMWGDGVVEKITFGYGSIHDMESFYIAICDDCITELEELELATNLDEIKIGIEQL